MKGDDSPDPWEIPEFLRREVTPENVAAMARIAKADRDRREGRNIKNPRHFKRKKTGLGLNPKGK